MSSSSEYPHTACFSVHAGVDPAVMSRVMGQFAKRGLVPSQWHSTVAGPRGDELHIDLQVRGLRPEPCEGGEMIVDLGGVEGVVGDGTGLVGHGESSPRMTAPWSGRSRNRR